MRKVYGFNNPSFITYEKNSGKRRVEVAGYIPADKQILAMINAGQRLDNARKNFDFDESHPVDESIPCDPTRSKGYDIAEASQDLRSTGIHRAGRKKVEVPPVVLNPSGASEPVQAKP